MTASPKLPMRTVTAMVVLAISAVGLTACRSDGRTMREPGPNQNASIITTTLPADTTGFEGLTSLPAESVVGNEDTGESPVRPGEDALTLAGFDVALPWGEGAAIDRRFTCDGSDIAPGMAWTGLPENTVEIAVVVTDLDLDGAVHWIITGIDPRETGFTEGELPKSAIVGTNSFGTTGWSGPCPPAGVTHTYQVEVHALSQQSEAPIGASAEETLRAIDFATVAAAFGTGTYTRR